MAFNGFNSTAFMSYIQKNNGLAEGYRFIVSIPALANDELLQFMCKEAIIPGKEIEIMEKTYGYGTTRQLPKSEKSSTFQKRPKFQETPTQNLKNN